MISKYSRTIRRYQIPELEAGMYHAEPWQFGVPRDAVITCREREEATRCLIIEALHWSFGIPEYSQLKPY